MTRPANLRPGVAGAAARLAVAALTLTPAAALDAADFRSTVAPATVLYDAPSAKARPLFVLGRDTPLEIIVPLEGWIKVRDVGGSIGWVEKAGLGDKRSLVVRGPLAEIRANPDDAAPLVFRAEQHVLLRLAHVGIHQKGLVAPLEQMTDPVPASIDVARITQ